MEICNKLIERDSKIDIDGDARENFEIQHTYIDFNFLIIGEKVRLLNKPDKLEDIKFDDEYFA